MAQTAGYRTPRFLTFKQALELGGNVRKGEHGTKVYFVKQLDVHDKEGSHDDSATRLVPLMRMLGSHIGSATIISLIGVDN